VAGLAAGACGGSLYDAEGVPKVDANGCGAGTHLCPGAAACVAQSPSACGDGCESCAAAPTGGDRTCLPTGAGGTYVCGSSCPAQTRVCGNACTAQTVHACGDGDGNCVDCGTDPANGTRRCDARSGANQCEFDCNPGFFKTATGCEPPTGVISGELHSCALTGSGAVFCWGANGAGQLGATPGTGGPTPVRAVAGGAAAIAAGGFHSCAITSAGVRCWGSNVAGQLGAAGGPGPVTAALAGTGTTASAIAAGTNHTCAVVTGGAIQCWGANGSGQLGTADTTGRATPTATLVTSGATQVTAFRDTTCALVSGAVKCWGANGSGQLGPESATPAPSAAPVAVPLPSAPSLVSVGGHHACAVTAGGVYCWGSDAELELGTKAPVASPSAPVQADKIDNNQNSGSLATGDAHTCAGKTAIGEVSLACAGRNDQSQTGLAAGAPTVEGNVPIGGRGLAASAGLDHTCALVASATDALSVACWGANGAGQLGRTTPGAFDAAPGIVPP